MIYGQRGIARPVLVFSDTRRYVCCEIDLFVDRHVALRLFFRDQDVLI
jgi:hypothetical protein